MELPLPLQTTVPAMVSTVEPVSRKPALQASTRIEPGALRRESGTTSVYNQITSTSRYRVSMGATWGIAWGNYRQHVWGRAALGTGAYGA